MQINGYLTATHLNAEQTLSQEERRDYKKVMSEKKTTLPYLRNQDWKTVKLETGKIGELLTQISTKVGGTLRRKLNIFYCSTQQLL